MHQHLTAVDDGTRLHATEDFALSPRTHTLCEDWVEPVDRADGTPVSVFCLSCLMQTRRCGCAFPTLPGLSDLPVAA